ncbi:MAG: 23S rRNA (adenine(2030)-N(6))-methyltransferase RlmJ [Gammaproteobacteria bacterium]|nr:23S rRNA (adenine(2030)-N(6))-methyltransferase RlmJ [Gammaproteobacteria bacterium]
MLSYQHSYHAGNFADIHKHIALLLILQQMQQKESALCFVDSHAGRGLYDLKSNQAQKTGEAEHGVLRLFRRSDEPAVVHTYLDIIADFNSSAPLRYYPGSAVLGQTMLRAQDKAILLELHPQEYPALRKSIGRDKRVSIHARDCYEGLPALVPPAIKRGLVLIDPSYEVKTEYQTITELLKAAQSRWSNAVYLVWYPILTEKRHVHLIEQVSTGPFKKTLNSEYLFTENVEGMLGSGLLIINTPWQFEDQFNIAMRHVIATLSKSTTHQHCLRWVHKD